MKHFISPLYPFILKLQLRYSFSYLQQFVGRLKSCLLALPTWLSIFICSLILTGCSFGNANPNCDTNINFTVINGSDTDYTDSGIKIKKIIGDQQYQVYVLNSRGHLWQYLNSVWVNLNLQPGKSPTTNFNDFYYANDNIFAITTDSPNRLLVYNRVSKAWRQLDDLPVVRNSNSELTVIGGYVQSSSPKSTNLLIGFNLNTLQGPHLFNCNYNNGALTACEEHIFTNQTGTLKTITASNNTVYISIDNHSYSSSLTQLQQWMPFNIGNTGNIVQILPLSPDMQYIASITGLSVFREYSESYPTIPAIPDGLNSQIMSLDSAMSLWVATIDNSHLYVIDRFNHLTNYTLITNKALSRFTSLYINAPISNNQIYLGTESGTILKQTAAPEND